MRASAIYLLAAGLVGCSDSTAPLAPQPVDNVFIRIAVPGRCLQGGCDPSSTDRTTLGLVTIVNTGTSTAYLRRCGTPPMLVEQHLQNGTWVSFIPPILCAIPPTPTIALAAGDSLQLNWFFEREPTRLVLDVGTVSDLSDAETDASAAVMILP